jgi:precorrin-6B methylase 1
MGQANAEVVAVGGDEHLRLVAQAAEGDREDDAVAVALERVALPARAAVILSGDPSARF